MRDIRPGDILLYAVTVRENGERVRYYGCEVVDSISGGRPLNLYGEPVTGVRAIYLRESATPAAVQGRVLLTRHEDYPDEKRLLQRALDRIYGPGELITGISCGCESACSILKKRLRPYSE
jgi:hypothetical protein